MRENHKKFVAGLQNFKKQLSKSQHQNLKYLQCRLDFNEYYNCLEIKQANAENSRKRRGGGDDIDIDLDYGERDYDDEDEDEEDDDEEEDDEDDEEEDDLQILDSKGG